MFNVLKGWPTGLGGSTEENIEVPKAVLENVTFEGASLAVVDGGWALTVAANLATGNQVASPASAKQNLFSVVFALDRYFTDGLGNPAYDVAYTSKLPVISGDFIAEFDTAVCPTLPTKGQYVTFHGSTAGKLAPGTATANVPVVAVCIERYPNEDGVNVARCRFFTPVYQTLA